MKTQTQLEHLIPSALLEQIEALAGAERRPVREMLCEAVESYLQERRSRGGFGVSASSRTPQQVAARIRELRRGNVLPDGVTLRELMTYGRA